MASPTIAANAYASLARMMETGGGAKPSDAGGQSFGALLKDAVGSVLETGRKSDAQTVAMASGKVLAVVVGLPKPQVAELVSSLVLEQMLAQALAPVLLASLSE